MIHIRYRPSTDLRGNIMFLYHFQHLQRYLQIFKLSRDIFLICRQLSSKENSCSSIISNIYRDIPNILEKTRHIRYRTSAVPKRKTHVPLSFPTEISPDILVKMREENSCSNVISTFKVIYLQIYK